MDKRTNVVSVHPPQLMAITMSATVFPWNLSRAVIHKRCRMERWWWMCESCIAGEYSRIRDVSTPMTEFLTQLVGTNY